MKLMAWLVVGMVATIAGITVYEAATNGLSGLVVIGFCLSVVGIWTLTAIDDAYRRQ